MLTDDIDRRSSRDRLNIAVLAPPWAPVTPESRDVERAIGLLCGGLIERGHRVTLFGAPGTSCAATVHEVLQPYGVRELGSAPFQTDYVARIFATLNRGVEQGRPFDVVHDHCGFAVIAMADLIPMPVMHTMHWSIDDKMARLYAQYADQAHLVATTETQAAAVPSQVRLAGVVPNPIDLQDWPLQPDKHNYIVWTWRFEPLRGAQEVISAAQAAHVPLVLSGPVCRGQERWFAAEIAPCLDSDQVRYVGEMTDDQRRQLISDARALLVPNSASDAYQTDIACALAAGTPVIAGEHSAATEIVESGRNGYLASDEAALTAAISALDKIDPRDCRETAVQRHGVEVAAARYEALYQRIAARPVRRRSHMTRRDRRSDLVPAAHHRRPRRSRIALRHTYDA